MSESEVDFWTRNKRIRKRLGNEVPKRIRDNSDSVLTESEMTLGL